MPKPQPPRVITGENSDPAFRRERSKVGAKARHSADAYIRAIVKRSSELTEDHKATLRALLADADGGVQSRG